MSEQGLPDGVETISIGLDALRRPCFGGAFAEDYMRVDDAAVVIDQARQSERERVRELGEPLRRLVIAVELMNPRERGAIGLNTEDVTAARAALNALDTLKEETPDE